ncbi:Uncharacterised protein [Kingella potus]|uniref:Uncharacterized protein n=1 Tax=Kingella potus TaxID=265175 RepID=A0A377R0V6_9NEIS|nr:hypothetical protein [Kingella potus]UOP01048.1 hypothetical protein LVJ84_01355 [Kingella potus]STR00729.1 Uncharacterised protein [Kingella potus]
MMLYKVEKSNYSFFENKTGISGDFASILWNGEMKHAASGTVNIMRFGPSVPSIYLHMKNLIVAQEIKDIFSKKLTGFTAVNANKKKIINADWQNLKQDFFNKYFSLSDVISKGKHSPEAANKMPDLWLIKPNYPLNFKKISNDFWEFNYQDESDFYYGSGDRRGIFISGKAKNLITDLGDWLVCSKI